MRVLVLHSDVPPDAPPDEQDTLIQALAVTQALQAKGHTVERAAFVPDKVAFGEMLKRENPEAVFNLVESVWGDGRCASLAPAFLAASGVAFTGARDAPMAATGDKLLAKRCMVAAGIATPAYAEAPDWGGLTTAPRWIVKSVDEDASLGLDDGAVVAGADVRARAQFCAAQYRGRWFAESYVEGREFNVAVLQRNARPEVLPIAEMRFENWNADRPKIVGYGAKWDADNTDFHDTVRDFTWASKERRLQGALADAALKCWHLFGLNGYARVDFRVDETGPFVLEVNANPCLSPDAGFAAAALQSGLSYADLIEHVLNAAQ